MSAAQQADLDSLRGVLDEEVAHAIVAVYAGHDVSTISIRAHDDGSRGRCITTPPTGGDPTLTALGSCMVLLAGRVLHPQPGQDQDVKRAEEIAAEVCDTPDEARALVELARARVQSLAERPLFQEVRRILGRRVLEAGGEIDMGFQYARDGTQPPVPNVIVNVPAPIVNVTVPPPPDKRVLFSHDADGQLVEAVTETAA